MLRASAALPACAPHGLIWHAAHRCPAVSAPHCLIWRAGARRYILPALSLVPGEAEESVRVEYAGILAALAHTAARFLARAQRLPAHQATPAPAPALVFPNLFLLPCFCAVPCRCSGLRLSGFSVLAWTVPLTAAGRHCLWVLLLPRQRAPHQLLIGLRRSGRNMRMFRRSCTAWCTPSPPPAAGLALS